MLPRLLADLLLLFHLGFVIFAVLGGLLVWRWSWAVWLHLPAAGWAAAIEVGGWICPLTPLENRLRLAAGQSGYSGGFVEHYILPVLYPAGLTRQVQFVLAVVVVAINLAIYGGLWWRRRAQRNR